MSKINRKTSLALAVMAACMLSAPAAFAVTVTDGASPSALPSKVANLDVKDATTVVGLGEVDINISNTDLIIGRTTGFSVRIDLAGGAKFAALGVPAIGSALPGGWTATVAAGGVNQTFVVYSVQPGGAGVINGPALQFAPGAITLNTVAGLKTAGTSVSATVTFADPNTAQQILTPVTQALITSADPLKFSIAASADPDEKINVSSAQADSKTAFAQFGNLGDAPFYTYDAGTLTYGVATGVKDVTGAGSFAWATTDAVAATVNGNFSAFAQTGASVKLVTAGTCDTPTASVAGTVAADKVTFSSTFASLAAGGTGILCFTLPNDNEKVIDATDIGVSATATRTATTASSSASGDAQAMAYNGPVAVVYTFNPAGNTTQQSFLRISNTGATDGSVTITGRDDAGNDSAGKVSLNLASGQSIQLTGDDLQNGNADKGLTGALGAGTGKWILTVTGEISGMEVTNLNRNNTSGTVSNFGTPVSGSH